MILILLASLLAACQGRALPLPGLYHPLTATPHPSPSPAPAATKTGVDTHIRPTEGTPSASAAAIHRTRYDLQVVYDAAQRRLRAHQAVAYTNTTGAALQRLPLVVAAARGAGVFDLIGAAWADGAPAEAQHDGARLWLELPAPLAAGDAVDFALDFTLHVPDGSGTLAANELQANFGDWYPYVPAFTGADSWILDDPGAVGEHLTYPLADFHVTIRLTGAGANWQIAAPAPADERDGISYYDLPAARNFAWSAGPHYLRIQGEGGVVAVNVYAFTGHEDAAAAVLQTTLDALELYSRLFGAYPHTALTAVECSFQDGMEYDGLYFLGREYFAAYDGTPANYLTTLAAHETAHQWWGGLVGNNPAREPWLDEALSTYTEQLYYEDLHPELVDWWHEFRIARYQPAGSIDRPVSAFHAFRPYVNAVYLRGADFLAELRRATGDTRFFGFLKDYAEAYSGRLATGADFLRLLNETARVDLGPLREAYFEPRP